MPLAANEPMPPADYRIRFPADDTPLDQDEEWFEFDAGVGWRRMRIHDYAALFSMPGLYEAVVYERLACSSPRQLAGLLGQVLAEGEYDPQNLRVLDLGAGNGLVAEQLQELGATCVVGVDLLPEARIAAERDRPTAYEDYIVANLCSLSEPKKIRLDEHRLNCLVIVAALGFGDIPPAAFATAFNALSWKGWLGLTIKEDYLQTNDDSGFASLLNEMVDRQIIEIRARHRYCHRLSVGGEKIYYMALVARKLRDLPIKFIPETE